MKAYDAAKALNVSVKTGNILSSDEFYDDEPDSYKKWAEYGVLCVEMETAALYTIAAKYRAKALAIFTISDSLVTHEATSSEERQSSFNDMVKIALGTL
jgi:purine-nucleoside phosphorylase